MAAVLIAIIVTGSGVWLTLVLTHTIPVESGWELLSHFVALLAGGALPLTSYWREKRIAFDITSDPPKGDPNAGK